MFNSNVLEAIDGLSHRNASLHERTSNLVESSATATDRRLGILSASVNTLAANIKDLRGKIEPNPRDGAGMIHQERLRQVEIGHTAEKDDLLKTEDMVRYSGHFAGAAIQSILNGIRSAHDPDLDEVWNAFPIPGFNKPNVTGKSAKELLVITGAMCAAVIDRINRDEARAEQAFREKITAAEEGR